MEIFLGWGEKNKAKLLFYMSRFWVTCDSLAPILGVKKNQMFWGFNSKRSQAAWGKLWVWGTEWGWNFGWYLVPNIDEGKSAPSSGGFAVTLKTKKKTWKIMFDTDLSCWISWKTLKLSMKSVKNGNFLLRRDRAVAAEGILMGIWWSPLKTIPDSPSGI